MSIQGVPLIGQRADGTLKITGYATALTCPNCGSLAHVADMLLDRESGEFVCTRCPGEGWLREHYGEGAVADLVAMREGEEGALTLDELLARYPETVEIVA